jgi:uncharacterized protein (DUF4415 family)
MESFRSHSQKTSGRQQPLGVVRLAREARPELVDAIEAREPQARRPKAEAPKVHIGFRLAADVVESVRASGPGYNVRVEQALRKAGFGAKAKKRHDAK